MVAGATEKVEVDDVEALFRLLGLATEAQREHYRGIGEVTAVLSSPVTLRTSSCTNAPVAEPVGEREER